MADPVEVQIMTALFTRLNALTLSPTLPIAWPGLSFAKPADRKFIRAQYVPNTTTRQHINSDGAHQFLGMLQVSVQWPSGESEVSPRRIAGQIADHFPADLILNSESISVRITKRPTVEDMLVEDDGIQIPVMIEWECYA